MILPVLFDKDVQGRDTNLYPIVIINKGPNEIRISTNSTTLEGKYYKPILLNVPAIRESIDIEKTRAYKISNCNLTISNYEDSGVRFSEIVADTSLINQTVDIYWVSPSVTTIEAEADTDAFRVYAGWILRYEHDDEKVKITVEDRSQTIHKELPLPKNRLGTENILPNYKNAPKPMVYGYVDKSPCVMGEVILEEEGVVSNEIRIIADSDDSISFYNYNPANPPPGGSITPLWVFTDNYINVKEITSRINNDGGQVGLFGFGLDRQFIIDDTSKDILLLLESENSIQNNVVIGYEQLPPHMIKPRRHFDEVLGINVSHWAARPIIENIGGKFGKSISGTVLREESTNQWNGNSAIQKNTSGVNITDPGDIWWNVESTGYDPGSGNRERCLLGVDALFNPVPESAYKDSYAELYIDYKVHFKNITKWVGLFPYIRWTIAGNGDDSGNIYTKARIITQENNSPISENPYDGFSSYLEGSLISGSSGSDETGIQNKSSILLYLEETGQDGYVAAYIDIFDMHLNHYMKIENMLGLKYYAFVQGRTLPGVGYFPMLGESPPLPLVVSHILNNELGEPDALDSSKVIYTEDLNTYSKWEYAFTVHDKINSKKLIEELSSASPYFPRYNSLGEFKFNRIKQTYIEDDYSQDSVNHRKILKEDCISFSYNRTKIEDVYTKIKFEYNWDYGREEFTESVSFSVEDLFQIGDGTNPAMYSREYYGFEPVGDDLDANTTLVIDDNRGKYIRKPTGLVYDYVGSTSSYDTAGEFAKWMLYWHCNSHLKMKVRLPLKYMDIEVGSICSYDDLLSDVKPYGINYIYDQQAAFTGDVVNGQQVYPVFMVFSSNRTLEYCEFEMIQLHNLSGEITAPEPIPGPMIVLNGEYPWNFMQEATVSDGNEMYASMYIVPDEPNGCPLYLHPDISEVGTGVPDYSTNFGGTGTDNMVTDYSSGIFVVDDIQDVIDDGVNHEAYQYWKTNGERAPGDPLAPKIYLPENCMWADTVKHELASIKIELRVRGQSTENAPVDWYDYGTINFPHADDYIHEIALNDFLKTAYSLDPSILEMRITYNFVYNDPTLQSLSVFMHKYELAQYVPASGNAEYSNDDVYPQLVEIIELSNLVLNEIVVNEFGYILGGSCTSGTQFTTESACNLGGGEWTELNQPIDVYIKYQLKIPAISDTYTETNAWSNSAASKWIRLRIGQASIEEGPLLGDINGDGVVNAFDLLELNYYISGVMSDPPPQADINGDGILNIIDIVQLIDIIMEV